MMTTFAHYILLADLFRYPDGAFPERVAKAQAFLDGHCPEAAPELAPFTAFVADASPITLEECYTRSFDVQAATTLDLGYVLFGDDYKRGAVLVNLNREHREAGNPCYSELADHLPNVLCLLPKMTDTELRSELVEKIILPALRKIIGDFEPAKMEGKKKVYLKHHKTWIDQSANFGTIYQWPLRALYTVMQADFSVTDQEARHRPTTDFLKNIGTEITLEAE